MPVRPLPEHDWLWPGESGAMFCTCSTIMGVREEGQGSLVRRNLAVGWSSLRHDTFRLASQK